MFIDLLIAMAAGIAAGTATGLLPGIHPNTVFMMIVSAAAYVSLYFSGLAVLVFIVSVAVSNTFTDFIPSLIFGAPEPTTALSVLPGHQMLTEGRGINAVALTVTGGLGVSFLTLLTAPVLIFIIPAAYTLIRPALWAILLLVSAWMVLSEPGMLKAGSAITFMLSGIFGIVTLNAFPSGTLIFPCLTGLFALSTMLVSLSTVSRIPEQMTESTVGASRRGVLSGWLAGWLAGMLPGLGSAQAGAIASQFLRARKEEFLTALGGINTSNILFTFIMFFTMEKTRSGAVWAISQFASSMTMWEFTFIMFTAVTVSFISAGITLILARSLLKRLASINYRNATLLIVGFLVIMSYVLTGPIGLIAAATGTFIGLFSVRIGIKRSHMMGYFLVPTILYFSGASPLVNLALGI